MNIKNEIKYYILFSFKENILANKSIINFSCVLSTIASFLDRYYKRISTLSSLDDDCTIKLNSFLIDRNVNVEQTIKNYNSRIVSLLNFIKDFYDDRRETEKNIWLAKNIKGIKKSASIQRKTGKLDFNSVPIYYRDTVKRYFITIITKKSWSHCNNVLDTIKVFFNIFYEMGYTDGFLETLERKDIEKYLYNISNKYNDKNVTYMNKFISYPRTFLEYIQMAQYDTAPQKEVSFLIFENDIPKRERDSDRLRRVKFVPEPILKQLDNNIMNLDRPQFIPIYILLRETGWRGTDILNLRYDNCLEQIWNSKEQTYNYYLCGEITKTGIAELKIPIRDKVAEMVQKAIDKARTLSNEENNPKKYLFNRYSGKLKGTPLSIRSMRDVIDRLVKEKEIKGENGDLYNFKPHALRHTRAKEYVEQGMGISIIQQILGHRSLQMTVHYATVSENILYEKWKDTEDLELFKVNTETNELTSIDTSTDIGENLVRYEYVKKNLDAVRVPFGVCFKPSKLPCKQQMNHCLTCASFCTTTENIPEYEEEIEKVKSQIDISTRCGRELWAEKNMQYLSVLEQTLQRVKEQKLVHKNGKSREDS